MRIFISIFLVGLFSIIPASAQTLEQMIGRRVIMGFPGSSPNEKAVQQLAGALNKGYVGGVILLGHNVKSPNQVKALTSYFRNAASFTPFMTVDQEGGIVQRLSKKAGFPSYPSAQWLSSSSTPQKARQVYQGMAKTVRDYGFNFNFGPVVDLAINPRNGVVVGSRRTYGKDVSRVHAFADAFVSAHHSQGIVTSLKHFPGHGSSKGDTHKGFVDITKTWKSTEILPYDIMFNFGYQDAVMVGHLYHSSFSDGQGIPTSLSQKAIRSKLRRQLGFRGVVITDDMDMGAITKKWGRRDAIIRAFQAGNDILLISNSGPYDAQLPTRIIQWVSQAVKSGQLSLADMRASYARVEALRRRVR